MNFERCDANQEFQYVEWFVEWFEGRINDLCTNRTSPYEDDLHNRRYGQCSQRVSPVRYGLRQGRAMPKAALKLMIWPVYESMDLNLAGLQIYC